MEVLVNDMTNRGETIDTDEKLRMPQRPSKTNTFHDFSPSFSRPGTTTRRDAEAAQKRRPKHAELQSTCSTQKLTDSSEDEIDAFSGSQASRDSSPPRNPSRQMIDEDYMTRVNQTTQPTYKVLPMLNFKREKNKAKDAVDSNSKAGPSASRLSPSKQLHKTSKAHQDGRVASSSNLGRSNSQISINSEHIRTSGATYASGNPRDENITSGRPKPRPTNKGVGRSELEEIPVNSQANLKSRVANNVEMENSGKDPDMNLTRRRTLVRVKRVDEEADVTPNARSSKVETKESRSTLSTSKPVPTVKKPRFNCKLKRTPSPQAPEDFPVLSPLSTHRRANVHKSPSMPNIRSKHRSVVDPCESPTPRPREFPMSLTMELNGSTSPQRTSNDRERKQIPKPRPKNSKSKKVKEAANLFTESEGPVEEDEGPSRPAPQPFPISAQMLTSISEPDLPELSALKRASGDTSSSSKPRKKRKNALSWVSNCTAPLSIFDPRAGPLRMRVLRVITTIIGTGMKTVCCPNVYLAYFLSSYSTIETVSMSLTVDPSLLCPFCDALLPKPPTPHLKKLMKNAVKKSRPDPRPGNPLGRKAPSAVFGIICQRHQFESEELPKANANGWPSSIDWEKLGHRVKDMRNELEGLLNDLQAGEGVSVFWEEIQLELQKKGSRAVASVQGQFANFDKGQPG